MRTFRLSPRVAFGLTSLAFLACQGAIDQGPGADENPGTPGSKPGSPSTNGPGGTSSGPAPTDPAAVPPERMMSAVCKGVDPGALYARRLTKREYNNTVRDLLGDTTQPATGFPTEQQVEGFDNNALGSSVSPALIEQYFLVADKLATGAIAKPAASWLPTGCDVNNMTPACVTSFIQQFGKRAFRRPPTQDEVTLIQGVYAAGAMNGGSPNGVRLAMMEMLMSPPFLYRIETAPPAKASDTIMRPEPYEMASRLSYLLWNSMPDEPLLQAAAMGKLSAAADIAAQAQRMIADKRATDVTNHFYEQWFDLDRMSDVSKDTTIFKTFTPALLSAMQQELMAFVGDLTWTSNGTVADLMTAPFTYANAQLASYYKLNNAPMGTNLSKVMLDPATSQREGLLTQGAILNLYAHANQTSPVLRGKFVRELLMCQRPPDPPNNVAIKLPDLDPKLTTRERFAQHATEPLCASCHTLMDPIGLGFEKYDAAGQYRTMENGRAIDDSGEVKGLSAGDGHFQGVMDLAKKLSTADEVRSCLAVKWFTYGYGRQQSDSDVCSLDVLKRTFASGGYKLKDLLVALTQTDAFLYRRVILPGGDQ